MLGSAPDPNLSLYREGDLTVSVNASAANLRHLGMPPPALTIIDFQILDPSLRADNYSKHAIVKHKMLAGLSLGTLVLTQSNNSPGGNPDSLNASYEHLHILKKSHCRRVVNSVMKSKIIERDINNFVSRGAFALALTALSGASSIVFEGFSLFKSKEHAFVNHFYNDVIPLPGEGIDWKSSVPTNSSWDVRVHSRADCCLISTLSALGFNLQTSCREFSPLLHNWGKNPPLHLQDRLYSFQ